MTRNIDTDRAENLNSPDQDWPEYFGKITSLEVKRGCRVDCAIITLDCDGSKQIALIFADAVIAQAERAANKALISGAEPAVWVTGPILRSDRDGLVRDEMRVESFEDRTDYNTAAA